jgi:hypothetical protein
LPFSLPISLSLCEENGKSAIYQLPSGLFVADLVAVLGPSAQIGK